MATLKGKTTAGVPAWDYYIKNNPQWKQLELKIENKMSSPLFTKKGSEMVPSNDMHKAGTKLKLLDNKLTSVGKVDFAKVKIGSKSGFVPISKIRKPSKAGERGTTFDEEVALKDLDKLIKQYKTPITIEVKMNGKTLHQTLDAVGAKTLPGTPKADFAIVSKSKGMDLFLSHKKAGGAKAFQQYSGVSNKAGKAIANHKEVLKFLRKLVAHMDVEEQKLVQPVYSVIKDKDLINMAIFGPNYKKGSKNFDKDYVQMIGQGNPILKPNKKKFSFTLEWSEHFAAAGDVKSFSGDLQPVFLATFRAGRKFEIDGETYTGARVMIAPFALAKGRSGLIEI